MQPSPRPELLDETVAADWLRLSRLTLRRWRMEGRGPTFLKVGGKVFYEPAAIHAYLHSCQRSSTSEEAPAIH